MKIKFKGKTAIDKTEVFVDMRPDVILKFKERDEVYSFENEMYLLLALRVPKQMQSSRGVP